MCISQFFLRLRNTFENKINMHKWCSLVHNNIQRWGHEVLFFVHYNFRDMSLSLDGKVTEMPIFLILRQGFLYCVETKNESVSRETVLQHYLQILRFHGLKFAQLYMPNIPLDSRHYVLLVLPCAFIVIYTFSLEDAIRIFIELYNETIFFSQNIYKSDACF